MSEQRCDHQYVIHIGTVRRAISRTLRCGKWAVIGSTETLAAELAPHGIRCNEICPGAVDADRIDSVLSAEAATKGCTSQDGYRDYASGSSLHRFARPEDMAQICTYSTSDAAQFVSGQAIAVDGNTATYHSV